MATHWLWANPPTSINTHHLTKSQQSHCVRYTTNGSTTGGCNSVHHLHSVCMLLPYSSLTHKVQKLFWGVSALNTETIVFYVPLARDKIKIFTKQAFKHPDKYWGCQRRKQADADPSVPVQTPLPPSTGTKASTGQEGGSLELRTHQSPGDWTKTSGSWAPSCGGVTPLRTWQTRTECLPKYSVDLEGTTLRSVVVGLMWG